jgi:Sigma-70, region 4
MPWQMPWLCSKNTIGAFILRDVNELSITETANVLGITRGAVKTRLRRARLMLREILLPELQQRGQVALAFNEARKTWEREALILLLTLASDS